MTIPADIIRGHPSHQNPSLDNSGIFQLYTAFNLLGAVMAKEQADLSPERAMAFRQRKNAEAAALGLRIEDYLLVVSRENDVEPSGPGPRYAIVKFAQKMARLGSSYGQVIGQSVKQGNGKTFKIAEADLLGYVCANDYCRLVQPEQGSVETLEKPKRPK